MDEKKIKKYSTSQHCPVRNVIDRIGDKWSLLVLLVLRENEVLRFNEIYSYIDGISQKMLSATLKVLEADDLVKRTVYPQIPPKVEYRLTSRGKSLHPHIQGLVNWAESNFEGIRESRIRFENDRSKN